jgi:hypothetical protein
MASQHQAIRLGPIFVSFCLALLYSIVLRNLTTIHFPAQLITLKGDRDTSSRTIRLEFRAAQEPAENIWTLEAITFDRATAGPGLQIQVNGTPVGPLRAKGKRLFAEFPSSLLAEGSNAVEISAETSWSFRRIHIRNIVGYSRGLISGVAFHRTNSYPEAGAWPRSAAGDIVLLVFFLLAFALGFLSIPSPRLPGGLHKACLIAGCLIPALFAALIILPWVSELEVRLEMRSAFILILLFYALLNLQRIAGPASRLSLCVVSRLVSRRKIDGAAEVPVRSEGKKCDAVSGSLILALTFLCLIAPGPVHEYGDSLEYCAMLVGWAERLTPRASEESWALMEKRLGRAPSPGGSGTFAAHRAKNARLVRNGGEMELPHFWFYSLAAALFYWPLRLARLDITLSFMLVHLVLLLIAFSIVRRRLGPLAGLSLMLIIFCSPLLWYANKTQVEFWTVVLGILGVSFLIREDWAASAFAFALASTQNVPFAILSAVVFASGCLRRKSALFKSGLGLWTGTLGLIMLQPIYYILSLGVLNPVVATGGATFGGRMFSPTRLTSVLVDPDIGLFPNWPLSLLLLFLFVYLKPRQQTALSRRTWIFLVISVPVLLWSQSRTTNLNHGGTYNISRYALWYLYVFFLAAWLAGSALERLKPGPRRLLTRIGLAMALLVCIQYRPDRPEQYVNPTWTSRILYDRLPRIYNPAAEIFIERYRGREESLPPDVWAVSNKSGNKICISSRRLKAIDGRNIPPILTNTRLNRRRVYEEARRRLAEGQTSEYFFINGLARSFMMPAPNGFRYP